jgi:hypothetical protein
MQSLIVPELKNYIVEVNPRSESYSNNQIVFKFPNGYGASLIQGPYSYGGNRGLFEIAVLTFNGNDHEICYTTDITDDVLGHLTEEDVISNLFKIFELEPLDLAWCNDERTI